jgi:hypothetical protein
MNKKILIVANGATLMVLMLQKATVDMIVLLIGGVLLGTNSCWW